MAAMHADDFFYMDTGATSHMAVDQSILSSYFNSSNNYHNIIVGNGRLIPIVGHGSTNLPLPTLHLSSIMFYMLLNLLKT